MEDSDRFFRSSAPQFAGPAAAAKLRRFYRDCFFQLEPEAGKEQRTFGEEGLPREAREAGGAAVEQLRSLEERLAKSAEWVKENPPGGDPGGSDPETDADRLLKADRRTAHRTGNAAPVPTRSCALERLAARPPRRGSPTVPETRESGQESADHPLRGAEAASLRHRGSDPTRGSIGHRPLRLALRLGAHFRHSVRRGRLRLLREGARGARGRRSAGGLSLPLPGPGASLRAPGPGFAERPAFRRSGFPSDAAADPCEPRPEPSSCSPVGRTSGRWAACWRPVAPSRSCVSGAAVTRCCWNGFRQLPNAVLLGTRAYWEGVDVRGRELTLLVIDRLPFPVPTEPLHAARAARAQAENRERLPGSLGSANRAGAETGIGPASSAPAGMSGWPPCSTPA